MKVLNCMQHQLTDAQIEGLSVQLRIKEQDLQELKKLDPTLFTDLANFTPQSDIIRELHWLADTLLGLVEQEHFTHVILPLGPPAFQFVLGGLISQKPTGPVCLFSHSERRSVEAYAQDGSVVKTATFKHITWIPLKMN